MSKYSDFTPVLKGNWFSSYVAVDYDEDGEFTAKATKRVKELIPFLHDLCENKGYEGEEVGWPTLVKQPGLYSVLGKDVFIYIEVIGLDVLENVGEFFGTKTYEDKAMWIWGCDEDVAWGDSKGYEGEKVPGAEFLANRVNDMAELDTLPWSKKWISFKISGGEGGGESGPDFGLEDLQFLHIQQFLNRLPVVLNWTNPQVKNLLERVI